MQVVERVNPKGNKMRTVTTTSNFTTPEPTSFDEVIRELFSIQTDLHHVRRKISKTVELVIEELSDDFSLNDSSVDAINGFPSDEFSKAGQRRRLDTNRELALALSERLENLQDELDRMHQAANGVCSGKMQ